MRGWPDGCADRCCCSARCSAGPERALLARARRRLSGAAIDCDARPRAHRNGRARGRYAVRPRTRSARRTDRRVDVPARSVGDGHRDGAARGRAGRRADGNPERGVRAARGRALPVPGGHGRRRSTASARPRSASTRRRRCTGRRIRSAATTSKPRRGASWPRSPAERSRSPAPPNAISSRSSAVFGEMQMNFDLEDGRLRRPSVEARRRTTHHDGALARVSERHRQSRHGPGDAGRRAGRSCTTGCTSCVSSRSSN